MTETTEIATRSPTEVANASTNMLGEVGALLDAMMQLAKDPTVDAAKFETISRVVKETREDAKREQFYMDKAAALLDMPVINKRGKIVIEGKNGAPDRTQGTYALWPDLQKVITPVLAEHNLFITHEIGHDGTICLVTPVLQHRNGFVEKGEKMALPLDSSGGKNNTQGAVSASSYGKRITSIAMLGIRLEVVSTDDDGWLIPRGDEPLNEEQQALADQAAVENAAGTYRAWFQKLGPKDRAWLVNTGRDAEFGGKALPGVKVVVDETKPPAEPRPSRMENQKTLSNHDINTPEGFTAQFEEDCSKAQTIIDLNRFKTKAQPGIDRLEERGHDDLHRRTVDAYDTARDRLAGGE